jgi:hypothetical protein
MEQSLPARLARGFALGQRWQFRCKRCEHRLARRLGVPLNSLVVHRDGRCWSNEEIAMLLP